MDYTLRTGAKPDGLLFMKMPRQMLFSEIEDIPDNMGWFFFPFQSLSDSTAEDQPMMVVGGKGDQLFTTLHEQEV